MLLFYVRHGDPTYNPDQLTPLGHRQAESVAKRLALFGLDEIYVSSSTRALETAQPTCELLKQEATVLDWTNESYAWQDLSVVDDDGVRRWIDVSHRYRRMLTDAEIRRLGGCWREHPGFADTTVVQGYDRIERETRAFMATLGYAYDPKTDAFRATDPNENKRVALFAHGGFGGAFLSCVLGIPYPLFATRFCMGLTGVTVLHFDPKADPCIPSLLTFSNDGHLYRDGLPLRHGNRFPF